MKISMNLLARWLEDYHPVTSILQPELKCEGVRIMSPDSSPDGRFVYVEKMTQFFSETNSEEIILIHQNNVIQLMADSVEDIFNRVIEAFEYYTDLEQRLRMAARLDKPEQQIADICSEIFGPTIIMDQSLYFLGISSKYQIGNINSAWQRYLHSGSLTLEDVYMLHEAGLFKNFSEKINGVISEQSIAAPYNYSIVSAYCDPKGNIIGHCIAVSERTLTVADTELMEWVIAALESIPVKDVSYWGNKIVETLMKKALDEKPGTGNEKKILFELQGWKADAWFTLIVVKIAEKNTSRMVHLRSIFSVVQKYVFQSLPDAITCMRDDDVVILVPLKEEQIAICYEYIRKKLEKEWIINNCVLGISLPFLGEEHLGHYLKQADELLTKGTGVSFAIRYFEEHALDSIALSADFTYSLSCIHPIVNVLEKYDEKYNTQYGETLKLFIQTNKSYEKVAKRMDIHRNTTLYRLNRIKEIYPIDLSSFETMMYLDFSFRLKRLAMRRFGIMPEYS